MQALNIGQRLDVGRRDQRSKTASGSTDGRASTQCCAAPTARRCGNAGSRNMLDLNKVEPRRPIAFARINDAALAVLPSLLKRWLPNGRVEGAEYVAKNPQRADSHYGSFKINLRSGRWGDFATGERGCDVISLSAFLSDLSQSKAALALAGMLGLEPHDG
jgi:hypothetical protein